MNQQLAKKLRKYARKDGQEYLHEIKSWKFGNRLSFAWWLLFGKEL